jgi:CO/xanthine dehydrogenase Mo-binding subunit
MTALQLSRRELLKTGGVMIVAFSVSEKVAAAAVRNPRSLAPEQLDSWLAISRDDVVTVYTGRIDMGTGIETAFSQVVAEELDVPLAKIRVVMGDTATTPDQGKSTASNALYVGAQPIRVAASAARAALIGLAGQKFGVATSELETRDGTVHVRGATRKSLTYGELIGEQSFSLELGKVKASPWGPTITRELPLKSPSDYTIVGTSVRRADIPAKVHGTFEYVHNVRAPGMLHGRVVHPPTFDAKLLSVDNTAVKAVPGFKVIRRGDFLAVVANREEDAVRAAKELKANWSTPRKAPLPDKKMQYADLRNSPVLETQTGFDVGDVSAAIANSKTRIKADYHFPYHLHGMLGPSCAVADVRSDRATIWSGSQWPQGDRADLAKLLGSPIERVDVVCRPASGSYGRLGADDAAADAALMSQATGRPVRVQWMRHDENGWEPVSPAMTMMIEAGLDEGGHIRGFDYMQWSASHATGERGNYLAWHLIGSAPGYSRNSGGIFDLCYTFHRRGRSVFVQPKFRAIYMRAPGGIQSIFAVESFMDELALAADADPVEFRLRHLSDPRDRDVLTTVAKIANWQTRTSGRQNAEQKEVALGRGIAMVKYGFGDTRVAMVADVAVERATGRVKVVTVFVAHDCGIIVNPDGVRNQIQGAVIQGLSRSLREEVDYSRERVTSLSWEQYPIFRFSDVPEIVMELINRPNLPAGAVGEISTVPTSAAVANAIFDATGARLREVPFTPDRVKALL